MSSGTPLGTRRLVAVLAGVMLAVLFRQLGDAYDYRSTAGVAFAFFASNELLFFVAHTALALPGLLLVGWGLAPVAEPPLVRALRATLRWRWIGAAWFAGSTAIYAFGRALVLGGAPITDDENTVLFGARMLAQGHLRVAVPQPESAFTTLFVYRHDGLVSAGDFVGGLLVRAASLITHLDSLLYAMLAAGTGCLVAHAAGLVGGKRASRIAAVLFLVSPAALTLSLTTHPHLAARAFVAAAIACYLRLVRDRSPRVGVWFGLCAGAAFLCRPFEAATLLSWMTAHLAIVAVRDPRARRAALASVAGLVPPLALFAWYNRAITGHWYLMPRFGPGAQQFDALTPHSSVERLGTHLALNLLLLVVWFLGPLGVAAVAAGLGRRAESWALLAGVSASLGLMLLHDNIGIHVVGPIHYSESVVPLTVLASLGVVAAWDALGAPAARLRLATMCAAAVVAVALFDGVALDNLGEQARVERLPFAALARAGVHHALVVAEPPVRLRMVNLAVRSIGSWVNQFPPPDPQLTDDLLFVKPTSDLAELRRRFPDRSLVRLIYSDGDVPVRVEPVAAP